MRHKNNGMAQIQHMISLLKEAESLMPDYPAFELICTESLRQTWDSHHLTGERELHGRRRVWLWLFRYFAPMHGMQSDIRIRALDRTGGYVCELVGKRDRGADGVILLHVRGSLESMRMNWKGCRSGRRNASDRET